MSSHAAVDVEAVEVAEAVGVEVVVVIGVAEVAAIEAAAVVDIAEEAVFPQRDDLLRSVARRVCLRDHPIAHRVPAMVAGQEESIDRRLDCSLARGLDASTSRDRALCQAVASQIVPATSVKGRAVGRVFRSGRASANCLRDAPVGSAQGAVLVLVCQAAEIGHRSLEGAQLCCRVSVPALAPELALELVRGRDSFRREILKSAAATCRIA